MTDQPTASMATLTNPTPVNPTFTLDLIGDYTIELVVNGGTEDSAPDSVVIPAENTQPVKEMYAHLTGAVLMGDPIFSPPLNHRGPSSNLLKA